MLVNDVQLEKALCSMLVSPLGKVILVSEVQLSKA